MHEKTIKNLNHEHPFHLENRSGEKRTLVVILLTGATMVAEILTGWLSGSMALLADGWHMGTHMAALGIALFAYRYARKHAGNPKYAFGTGKVGVLSGYTSAIVLGGAALLIIYEAIVRLVNPVEIRFNEALLVAFIGLMVNVVSARLLHHGGHHHHDEEHTHEHTHGHTDHNLRAAYFHVLADALTSVLAIGALLAGKHFGWQFLDPVMGIVGGVLIGRWAWGLLHETGSILLDEVKDEHEKEALLQALEADGESRVADLHLWRVNSNELSLAATVVTGRKRSPDYYRTLVEKFPRLVHSTFEIHGCIDRECRCRSLVSNH
jgi:cation diffusion facilitator family transporter